MYNQLCCSLVWLKCETVSIISHSHLQRLCLSFSLFHFFSLSFSFFLSLLSFLSFSLTLFLFFSLSVFLSVSLISNTYVFRQILIFCVILMGVFVCTIPWRSFGSINIKRSSEKKSLNCHKKKFFKPKIFQTKSFFFASLE